MTNRVIALVLSVIALVLCGYGLVLLASERDTHTQDSSIPEIVTSESQAEEAMYVYITGAVKNPGVYKLQSNSRLYDLVNASGGFSHTISYDFVSRDLNLGQKLSDQDFIYIPTSVELTNGRASYQVGATAVSSLLEQSTGSINTTLNNDKCSINSSTKARLMEIKGIGEVYASKIITARPIGSLESLDSALKIPATVLKTIKEECVL